MDSAGRTADVEGPHRQLRARLADRLCRDHADRLTQIHHLACGQVAPVALDADAPLGFAGEHRADLDLLDTGRLDFSRQMFRDFFVDADDHLAGQRVLDVLERDAAYDTVAQGLDDLAAFDDGRDVDAVESVAVVDRDDHVLRYV